MEITLSPFQVYFTSGKKFIDFLETEGGGIVRDVEEKLCAMKSMRENGAQDEDDGKIGERSSDDTDETEDEGSNTEDPSSPSLTPIKRNSEQSLAKKTQLTRGEGERDEPVRRGRGRGKKARLMK